VDEQSLLETNDNLIGININRTLTRLMNENHVSMSVIYRNTGIAIPTIKRLQSDPTANPTIATLLPIAQFFGVTVSQLIGIDPLPSKITGYVENKTFWLKVPIINWDQILDWKVSQNFNLVSSYVLVDIDVGDNPIALKVEEDDWPIISKGSILIINTGLTPEHKDYALVNKRGQNNPTLKQIMIDDDKIYLKPMNTYFSPTLSDGHEFLGVLIQIRKDTKV
jgi:transcriptional regulator with XRE-family HTH domain